jgi:hypothetical protein
MAKQVKRISADLGIYAAVVGVPTTIEIGQVVPNNAVVTINGNLTVRGTTTTVNSEELSIADNFITLNSDVPVTTAATEDAGIVINRGSDANVSLRWNETVDQWQITNDGSTFQNIATVVNGNYLSAVVEDLAPQLGGHLDVGQYIITSNTSVVISPTDFLRVDGPVKLENINLLMLPQVDSNATVVYASPSTGGGSGVFVTSGAAQHEELVSKKKAIVFSLLF